MHIDGFVALAGLIVGFVVGLTGMGGGALMTPILVVVFGIKPLAAVSSDLAASVVMKPIGGAVHLRRGTVNLALVRWLCLGSVPSAFAGVLILKSLGHGQDLQNRVSYALGVALLLAVAGILVKGLIQRRRPAAAAASADAGAGTGVRGITVQPLPTVLIGVVGGLVVGMTSVGSGSLMIVLLLALYPTLLASQLVGTDLVQAIPLVLSAALGHALFGDLQLSLTTSLLIGSIPGVYAGARLSARAPDWVIRPVLVLVLLLSALKLFNVPNGWLGAVLAVGVVLLAVLGARRLRDLRDMARRLRPAL